MTQQKIPVFSVRVKVDDIAEWKMYAQAADMSMTNLVTEAMNEYIENHPLKGLKLQRYVEMKTEAENKKFAKVRKWVEDTAKRIVNGVAEDHAEKWGWEVSEEDTEPYITELVDEIMEDWSGTEDPLDDENEHERNLTEDYLEDEAWKITEELAEKYDEWKEEQEEKREFEEE